MNKKLILVCVQVFLLLSMATACRTVTDDGDLAADVAVPIEVSQIDVDRNQPESDDTADANLTTTSEGAVIVVQEDEYDFGVAIEGTVISHAFMIENQGDEVLDISRVWSSCGCTTTELADTALDPGDIRRIVADVDTSGFGGSTISKTIHVESTDPERSEIILTITGKVVPETAYLIDAANLSRNLALLIDVRDHAAYAAGHLLGAVSLTVDDVEIWVQVLPKEMPIILCDQDGDISSLVVERMLQEGFVNLSVLMGGLDEWIRQYGDRMISTLPLIIGVMQLE